MQIKNKMIEVYKSTKVGLTVLVLE